MPSRIYDRQKYKKPPRSNSGLKGVIHFPDGKQQWKAYLRHQNQYLFLGYFETKAEATMAYNREAC